MLVCLDLCSTCVSLSSSRLCHIDILGEFVVVWLHSTPKRLCSDVTTWDASPWCRLLCAYLSLFCSVQWYACHACLCHLLALYASLHACLHVHAWVLLASVSSMLQHNEAMDIRSKSTFVPCGYHLLFVFLFVCRLFCLFACILASLFTMSIVLVCFMPISRTLCALSFHCLSASFLVFGFACTHMEWGHTELGRNLLDELY